MNQTTTYHFSLSFFFLFFLSLELSHHQRVVNSLLLHQFIVSSLLMYFAFSEREYLIGWFHCWQSMGYYDSGTSLACLYRKMKIRINIPDCLSCVTLICGVNSLVWSLHYEKFDGTGHHLWIRVLRQTMCIVHINDLDWQYAIARYTFIILIPKTNFVHWLSFTMAYSHDRYVKGVSLTSTVIN